MIDALSGTLVSKMPTSAVVRMGGISIRLHISVSCFETLPAVGQTLSLLTYLHVREDALQLYGFADHVERELFERMIAVSGIGPRLAVGILSGATASRVREALQAGDAEFLQTLPGVGKKLAQRLVVELSEKAPAMGAAPAAAGTPGALGAHTTVVADAAAALTALGFSRSGAMGAAQDAVQELGAAANVESVVRRALQQKVR
ncbi:MAG TPA: Holliday junction branch migration protein RuvA [Candidatus Omnitrophota bacterium]|jgi:Holliday junction DNA helicase RuvA|nr:Holliday junction branch migration protein RuvA [Candidatus Omnitrophota bacterium]